jgi:hypothetical protein
VFLLLNSRLLVVGGTNEEALFRNTRRAWELSKPVPVGVVNTITLYKGGESPFHKLREVEKMQDDYCKDLPLYSPEITEPSLRK